MKKCHLAAQVCLLREGCSLGLRHDTWEELRQASREAQSCGDAGPPIPPYLQSRSLTPPLLEQVARRPSERVTLLKLWERHHGAGAAAGARTMQKDEEAPPSHPL